MSSDEMAISVNGLSKCYEVYTNPSDRLKQFILPSLKRLIGKHSNNYFREFWALRDVSFEIQRGEVIGIIGRNGSGKSTLLQMICGTLTPTSGNIQTRGRIAALLELGSGFNPEFTGRENVFMNAAVLGLTNNEINKCFNEIADFADIGDFIDQPVKTYSSGMVVRLAFAVSVFAQPDILVVDEALSVGDIAFRNKCMEVIQQLVLKGVTILFVTHDLGTLQLLCTRVIWLANGEMRANGDPVRVAQDYYVSTMSNGLSEASLPPQQDTGRAKFVQIQLLGGENDTFDTCQPLRIRFVLRAQEDLPRLVFAVSVYRSDGDWLIGQTSRDEGVSWNPLTAGNECIGYLTFQSLSLAPGNYLIALAAYSEDYSLCYAMTDICMPFSVRANFPMWGKFYHPSIWSSEST